MGQKLRKEWACMRRALQLQAGHYDSMGAFGCICMKPSVGFIQTEAAGADH